MGYVKAGARLLYQIGAAMWSGASVVEEEYDYVIIGAGSAGCLLANRLVGAGFTVCLLEAGGAVAEAAGGASVSDPMQYGAGGC